MTFTIGKTASMSHTVTESDLATNWKNDIPVLATPILLWLAEITCMKVIENDIIDGMMSLGYQHRMGHFAPTSLGWSVDIHATLVEVDGKKLTFDIQAEDKVETILKGKHDRFVVKKEKFIEKINKKSSM